MRRGYVYNKTERGMGDCGWRIVDADPQPLVDIVPKSRPPKMVFRSAGGLQDRGAPHATINTSFELGGVRWDGYVRGHRR